MSIPVVKKDEKEIYTLYVKDQPFFCYSGEIHNSSVSDLEFMKKNVWPNVRDMHLNSLIVPVYWENIEETEGNYDFTLVDGLIKQADTEGIKLILLWFGLWKNGESMYVPGWMKRDTEKYFRVQKPTGERINTISPLCEAAVEKDRAAFVQLMRHLREIDQDRQTVIMIQVENEIGVLGCACDYSGPAREAFEGNVPEVLEREYGKNGSWKDLFGEDAGEAFMSYYFARAVEVIAEAGRKEYPLPCYANAWLKQYPWNPGSYPSGGPVVSMHRIWKVTAPSLFTLAPDIYVSYCADIMDEYAKCDNPLFVPEIRKDAVAASYCLYAFAAKNAIGFSPFGVEELALDPDSIDKPPMEVMIALNIDPSAFDTEGSREYLSRTYDLMKQMEPIFLKYRGTEHMKAFVRHGETDYGQFLRFKDYDVAVAYAPRQKAKPLAAGVIIELSPEKFLVAGMQSTVTFRVKEGEAKNVDYIKIEEVQIENGELRTGRILNGDEKMAIKLSDMPTVYQIELFKY